MIPLTGMAAAQIAAKVIGGVVAVGTGIGTAVGLSKDLSSTRSLTDVVKLSRVEPLTIVDSDLANWEYTSDILQTTLSIFAGYYLQAISMVGAIDSVKVLQTLKSVNPTAEKTWAMEQFALEQYGDKNNSKDGGWKLVQESYKWQLPKSTVGYAYEALMNPNEIKVISLEANNSTTKPNQIQSTANNGKVGVSVDRNAIGEIHEASNLAVGKMINVTLSEGGNNSVKVTLPIAIRLATTILSSKHIESILTMNSQETNIIERFHKWRAGRIEFINDLILCQDMIDQRKRLMLKDKTGVYSSLINNVNNNTKNTIFGLKNIQGRQTSLAASSNIVLISSNTLTDVENKLGNKISRNQVRENIFNSGYMMILAVVDKQTEIITFYHRGINLPTELSVRDIKISNKKSGPDILEIMKAFTGGNALHI